MPFNIELNKYMDRKIFPKILIVITFVIFFILSGCDRLKKYSQNFIKDENKNNENISIENDLFNKKLECKKLTEDIERKIAQIKNSKNRNVVLSKIFYSPSYNSCLYAYMIEDDPSTPQCKIEGNVVHYDTFIIKDYLTSKNILHKTKGCENFWGDSFIQKIEKLEN